MEYTILGRSGLKVSIAGLGCGGHSRLGQTGGKSEKHSMALVRQALDMGINFIDTAEAYGTEAIVGKAVQEVSRDQVVISTKTIPPPSDHSDPTADLNKALDQSLRRLRTDYVDVYHLHGVRPEQYRFARNTLAPVLLRMREQGKIRSLGITEIFTADSGHRMLQEALEEDFWDVVMVGFNLLNPSARERVFSKTLEKNIGVLIMFAVRRALSQPAELKKVVTQLKQKGEVRPDSCDSENPLDFLTQEDKASTIPEAAYRYCRYEPGAHVVLTGTGNPEHLQANLDSLLKPPLVQADLQRLQEIFGNVDSVSGN